MSLLARDRRRWGVLAHVSSLPGPFGAGTVGASARDWVRTLALQGAGIWQFLPLGPTEGLSGHSPYAALSAFAGNPLLVDPGDLWQEGWMAGAPPLGEEDGKGMVDWARVEAQRTAQLRISHEAFQAEADAVTRQEQEAFARRESFWLKDYALHRALSDALGTRNWRTWPLGLRDRRPAALRQAAEDLRVERDVEVHAQFLFHRQWRRLQTCAREAGILLLGDLPIYVHPDGADTWAHRAVFDLSPGGGALRRVAGVPPDYFAQDGQRWGNPLYRWWTPEGRLCPQTLRWWQARLRKGLKDVDWLRVDHFRAFESFWSIPARSATARAGRWRRGPGAAFFQAMPAGGKLPLLAEDLGMITPGVHRLRQTLGYPGMKVLQFAFDGGNGHEYLPTTHTDPNCVAYTCTHDNDTWNGWFYESGLDENQQRRILDYLGVSSFSDCHRAAIRGLMASTARWVIFPVQDVMGYGQSHRFNRPGQAEGNWRWRLTEGHPGKEDWAHLARWGTLYGRSERSGAGAAEAD